MCPNTISLGFLSLVLNISLEDTAWSEVDIFHRALVFNQALVLQVSQALLGRSTPFDTQTTAGRATTQKTLEYFDLMLGQHHRRWLNINVACLANRKGWYTSNSIQCYKPSNLQARNIIQCWFIVGPSSTQIGQIETALGKCLVFSGIVQSRAYVDLILGQCRRRWANIRTTSPVCWEHMENAVHVGSTWRWVNVSRDPWRENPCCDAFIKIVCMLLGLLTVSSGQVETGGSGFGLADRGGRC